MEKIINILGINYIVDTTGKIYSTKNHGRGKYHKEIKQRKDPDGYLCITAGKKEQRSRIKVHRIIALAFIPNPNNLPEVDHIDNNKINNKASNLQWISSYDNKSKIPFNIRSLSHRGENNGKSKLNDLLVLKIREKYHKENLSIAEISRIFNTPQSTIYNIVHNKTWKHLLHQS